MPRPIRSGSVLLSPAIAVLAVTAVLGGLVAVSTGAAVVAGTEIAGCDPGRAVPGRAVSGAVLGGLAGARIGACAGGGDDPGEPEEPDRSEEPVSQETDDPGPQGGVPEGAVSTDGRTFTRAGLPFFWLGDTAWSLFVNLTRAETEQYLDTRADQGFTVIQAVAIFPQAGGPGPNQYGDSPYGSGLDDLAVTDGADHGDDDRYDYWDHVDFVVRQAAQRGLVLAILPVWADTQVGELVTAGNAAAYGRFLGRRYGDAPNVVWVLGGDAPAAGAEDVWDALAAGIRDGGGHQLMTYHPRGDQTSAAWFDGTGWIGFHMLQGGHCLRHDVRAEVVARTYAAGLPFVDGEPVYEDHPYCWRPEDGYSTPLDVRRDAYWSVLGGAAGHTYGHHAVWQFLAAGRRPELGARGQWTDALTAPGAEQMQNLRALVESRPRVEPSADAVPDQGSGAERIQAAVAPDGSTLMAYTAAGRAVTVDLDVLAGGSAQPWWFDPRTGGARQLDRVRIRGTRTFTPPAADGDESDWVLVVDAVRDGAEPGFGAPGAGGAAHRDRDRGAPDAPAAGTPDPAPETGASGQDLDDPDTEVAPGSTGDPGHDRERDRAGGDEGDPKDGDEEDGDEEDGAEKDGAEKGGDGGDGPGEDGSGAPQEPTPTPAPRPGPEPPPPPSPSPAPPSPPSPATADPVWDRLAQCESSGNWSIDIGNGYHGGLQFDSATWRAYGGREFAPEAHMATREQQITVAVRVRDDRGGYGSWPACAKRLGLPRWSRWTW